MTICTFSVRPRRKSRHLRNLKPALIEQPFEPLCRKIRKPDIILHDIGIDVYVGTSGTKVKRRECLDMDADRCTGINRMDVCGCGVVDIGNPHGNMAFLGGTLLFLLPAYDGCIRTTLCKLLLHCLPTLCCLLFLRHHYTSPSAMM